MLFSDRDRHWKLADFGTATKATSKRLHTTRYARGTTCYRAPELLKDHARVNNKADIFALGCILYEVTTGQKLFPDDWNIHGYALKGEPIFPNLWPDCDPGSRLFNLGVLAQSLLEIEPLNRPSAAETAAILQLIRQGKIPPVRKLNDPQELAAVIRPPSPPRNVTVTQVQYRRSSPPSTAAFSWVPPSHVWASSRSRAATTSAAPSSPAPFNQWEPSPQYFGRSPSPRISGAPPSPPKGELHPLAELLVDDLLAAVEEQNTQRSIFQREGTAMVLSPV